MFSKNYGTDSTREIYPDPHHKIIAFKGLHHVQ